MTEEARVGLGLPPGFQDLDEALGRWLDSLAIIASRPGGREVLAAFAAYVWKISDTPEQRMREFMATVEPEVAEPFVSTADRLRARGQAEMLVDLLTRKFGDLDADTRDTVLSAPSNELSAWGARLIEGTLTLADITG